MAKKILIYSTAYWPLIGGAEVAVKEITDRLLEYDFTLITARLKRGLPKREKVGRIEVVRLGWGTPLDKLWLAFWGGFWGSKLARKEPFDCVWGVMASFGGLAALRFKELNPSTRFLLTLQEGDDLVEIEAKMRLFWWRFKKIFTLADHVQAISHFLSNWAQKMGALSSIDVVPNGVDLNKFKFVERQNNQTIITTSRLVKKNDVENLIKALLFLPENYKLKILGLGPEEKKLKDLVQKLRLDKRVDFLGFVENEKLPEYLSGAEVFARPALSEGLGNSYLEAMACGLPIIGTKVGGIPDFLKDGETGWFCEVGNPFDLAEKIKLITDPNNKEQVSRVVDRARKLIEEKYDWAKIADQMREIFAKI